MPCADHDAEARELVELYAERVRMTAQMAADTTAMTGAAAEAVLAKGAELEAACETFRRRHYPRRARVIVGLYAVLVCSARMQRTQCVLDLMHEHTVSDEQRSVR